MSAARPSAVPLDGRRALASIVVTALAVLAALVPTPAVAADETVGGTTRETAVPLPIPDLDSEVLIGNLNATGNGARWYQMAWYSWQATTTQDVYIRATSVSPAGWDNALEVWQGGSLVVQNDDSYGLDAAVRVSFVAGQVYTIGLGAYSSGRGTARLTFATRVPSAPRDVAAVPSNGAATLTWTAPEDLAGGVVRYDVTCQVGTGTPFPCRTVYGTPPPTAASLTSLANGEPVTATVTASNVLGASVASAPVTVVPQSESITSLSWDPAAPVSGEPFDVRAWVVHPAGATGTVDIVVGDVTYADVPLVDGVALVEDVTAAAGTVPVTATYSGTAAIRSSVMTGTVPVLRRGQSVTLDALPDGLVYAGAPVEVVATASSGLPVTLTSAGACTLDGTLLSPTDVGTCFVTATQAGDSETLSAAQTITVTIGQRSQTLSVADLPVLVYGQEPFVLGAASDAGLPVDVIAVGACTLDDAGALVTTGVGECTVGVGQPGDPRTIEAATLVRTTQVVRRTDVVTFGDVSAPVLGAPVPVGATSGLGLPVTLGADGACVLQDGALWVVATGSCVVTATTEGDELTAPATATRTVVVADVSADVTTTLGAQLGDQATGAGVYARGAGLRPGTAFTLTVHSTPQVLATAVVGADGTALVSGDLPAGLELGDHRLVATGTALGGAGVASETTFQIGPDGVLVRIGDRVLTPTVVPTAASAAVAPASAALATTGGGAGGVLVQAVLWILLGAAALVVARRRPTC